MAKKTNTKTTENVVKESLPIVEEEAKEVVETTVDEQTVEPVEEPKVEEKPIEIQQPEKVEDVKPVKKQFDTTFKSKYNYIWNGIGY